MKRSRFVAALWMVLQAGVAAAGVGVVAPPEGARVVDFDDVYLAPDAFLDTTALRGRYAPVGVEFTAPSLDGGAVLDQASSFFVTGYSEPNFLAFNAASTLSDGGKPVLPQTLLFRHPVRYVQVNVGSYDGNAVTIEAFDRSDVSLGDNTVNATGQMQTLAIEGRHIAKVVLTGGGNGTILDDLAFVPDTTLIDFDEAPAPTSFSSTTALKKRYAAQGVTFTTINAFDGGAILDEDANFTISGYSAPNFLAFNASSTLSDGGKPQLPEWMLFSPPVRHVEFLVGSASGGTFEISAYDFNGVFLASDSVTLSSTMQAISVTAPGIATVAMTSAAPIVLLDDLEFEIEGTLIDFDDAEAPAGFLQTTALRDRYEPLGIFFRGSTTKNGAAILHESSNFGVSGYSGENFLAFNEISTLQDGGSPVLPQTLLFQRPIKRIDVRVGDPGGGRFFLEAYNVLDQLTGSTDVYATAGMQSLMLPAEGTTRVEITSSGSAGVIDDIAFSFVDPCAHDICAAGDPLDRNCDSCATIVCDADADCCSDDWSTACAKSVSMLCEHICLPICGDANDDRKISAPDALVALRTSVGTGMCPIDRCDYSGDGSVKAADALLILKAGVGQVVTPKCPLPLE